MAGNKHSVARAEPDRRSGHIIRVADVAQKPLFDQILLALGVGFGEVFHQRRAAARPRADHVDAHAGCSAFPGGAFTKQGRSSFEGSVSEVMFIRSLFPPALGTVR